MVQTLAHQLKGGCFKADGTIGDYRDDAGIALPGQRQAESLVEPGEQLGDAAAVLTVNEGPGLVNILLSGRQRPVAQDGGPAGEEHDVKAILGAQLAKQVSH